MSRGPELPIMLPMFVHSPKDQWPNVAPERYIVRTESVGESTDSVDPQQTLVLLRYRVAEKEYEFGEYSFEPAPDLDGMMLWIEPIEP